MIGIYKITNLLTREVYIGESINVERRISEHKLKNASGNDRLHNDIQKYGTDSFRFELIEECSRENLLKKELEYIHKLSPEYNEIGRPRSKQTKQKLSEAGTKQWNRKSKVEKDEFAKNNLTGPRVGHTVSEETRSILRSYNLGKKMYKPVEIIELELKFENYSDCAKYLNVTVDSVRNVVKGKTKKCQGYKIVSVV